MPTVHLEVVCPPSRCHSHPTSIVRSDFGFGTRPRGRSTVQRTHLPMISSGNDTSTSVHPPLSSSRIRPTQRGLHRRPCLLPLSGSQHQHARFCLSHGKAPFHRFGSLTRVYAKAHSESTVASNLVVEHSFTRQRLLPSYTAFRIDLFSVLSASLLSCCAACDLKGIHQ